LPCAGAWATPEIISQVAREADANGFAGLWTFQRWLATDDMAGVYQSVLDPLVALGYAAAVTERARLGVAIVNAPFYSPVAMAKQFATVDVLSNGRLDAGVGLGWMPQEYAAADLPTERRGKRFDEWIDCVDALLRGDQVKFSGEFYEVPPTTIAPRCVQRPRVPILVGGNAPQALRRAAVRGDGWISSSRMSLEDVAKSVRTVRDFALESGKAADAVRCIVRGVTMVRDDAVDGQRRPLTGTAQQIRDDLAQYAAAGVDEVFLDLNFDSERVGNPSADPAVALDLLAQVLPLGAETF
jgi:probable F420-dependent oxidoreductase